MDSSVEISNNFIPEEAKTTQRDSNSSLLLSGSTFTAAKSVLFGRGRPNDLMQLDRNSTFTAPGLAIGGFGNAKDTITHAYGTQMAVTNSTLTLLDGDLIIGDDANANTGLLHHATVTATGGITVGNKEYGYGNVLHATNSTLNITGAFQVGANGATNNTAVLHDVALSASTLTCGGAEGASGNVLAIGGTNGTLTCTSAPSDKRFFLGEGSGNEVCLFDNFAYSFTDESSLLSYAPSNTVRIASGATASHATGSVSIGNRGPNSFANTLRIEDGASFTCYRFALGGQDNRIVVSNGTLKINRKEVTSHTALVIGGHVSSVATNSLVPARNALVIQGTRSRCGSVGETIFCGTESGVGEHESSLTFDLPGAALETVPLESGVITMEPGSVLHVRCESYLRALGKERDSVVLARASLPSRISIAPDVLSAANAELMANSTLGGRCKLAVSGTDLVLNISQGPGLTIIVK